MPNPAPLNVLALGCFNTGEPFIRRARERGARVWVLTREKYLGKSWPRDALEDVLAMPDEGTLQQTLNAVGYLSRKLEFHRIVPFDDIEVDVAAALREHLRVPGMGDTRARLFRDKLAMRMKAAEAGIDVPAFVHVLNHARVRAFTERVAPPWMLKPRSEAASTGIKKIRSAEELWPAIEALGDRASDFLLEQYLPGDVHHVDSIVTERKVVFAEVHRNGAPPFDVSHAGGIFTTYTLERGSADERAFRALNERVLTAFGLLRGTAHLECIKGHDGKYYFLEVGARVGGAHVGDLVEAATGVNLWAEWADIELDAGQAPYQPPPARQEYGGLIQTLARQARPDTAAYDDPEVVFRADDKHHAGLVVRSPSFARVQQLLADYTPRFARDFHTALPHYELPARR